MDEPTHADYEYSCARESAGEAQRKLEGHATQPGCVNRILESDAGRTYFLLWLTEAQAESCRLDGLQVQRQSLDLSTCDRVPYHLVCSTEGVDEVVRSLVQYVPRIVPHSIGKKALEMNLTHEEAATLRRQFPSLRSGRVVMPED